MWLFEGLKPLFAAFAREQWGAETAAAVLALAKPAIRLDTNKPWDVENERTSARSRFGGWPLLDPGTEWPVWEPAYLAEPERVRLTFVGLLNLAELSSARDVTGLPARGFLNFFYAWSESFDANWLPPWGEPDQAGGWRVVLADPETAAPVRPPDETAVYPAWTLNWQQIDTLPSHDERELRDAFEPPCQTRTGRPAIRTPTHAGKHTRKRCVKWTNTKKRRVKSRATIGSNLSCSTRSAVGQTRCETLLQW